MQIDGEKCIRATVAARASWSILGKVAVLVAIFTPDCTHCSSTSGTIGVVVVCVGVPGARAACGCRLNYGLAAGEHCNKHPDKCGWTASCVPYGMCGLGPVGWPLSCSGPLYQ